MTNIAPAVRTMNWSGILLLLHICSSFLLSTKMDEVKKNNDPNTKGPSKLWSFIETNKNNNPNKNEAIAARL